MTETSSSTSRSERLENWRKRCYLTEVPADFLRISSGASTGGVQGPSQPVSHHRAGAIGRHPVAGYSGQRFGDPNIGAISGYLRITVNQARLAKNYGISRMDPYCRIRIGHAVLETPAAYNGSKNPRWNQVLHCQLPRGIPGMHFEIFNERYLAPDSRIAWGYFDFPQELMNGDTIEEWLPLSGQQGEEKEGVLNVILTFQPFQSPMSYYTTAPTMQPVGMPGAQMYYHGGYPPNYQQPAPTSTPQMRPSPTPQISEQSVKQLKEMFPQMDDEVLRSVLVAKGGSVEKAINELLSMS